MKRVFRAGLIAATIPRPSVAQHTDADGNANPHAYSNPNATLTPDPRLTLRMWMPMAIRS